MKTSDLTIFYDTIYYLLCDVSSHAACISPPLAPLVAGVGAACLAPELSWVSTSTRAF